MHTRIHLVRHGQTDANTVHRYMGRSADSLNATGRGQAQRLARRLSGKLLAPFCCSPLRRAVETACIISGRSENELLLDEAFLEIEFGPWAGLTRSEVAERYPRESRVWREEPGAFVLPGAETLRSVQDRSWHGLQAMLRDHPGGNGVIITHDAVIRCLLLKALDLDFRAYRSFNVDNTSLTILELETGGRFTLRVSNETCHLR